MSDDNTLGRVPAPAIKSGGIVEAASRADVVKQKYQATGDPSAMRYELRDPLAGLTYRATEQAEIVAKAEQLGSTRYLAIDADGLRTPFRKIDGSWHAQPHLPPRAPAPEQQIDDEPIKARGDKTIAVAPPQPEPPAATRPTPDVATTALQEPQRALARLDAKTEQAAKVAQLEAALRERYVIRRSAVVVNDVAVGRMEYRYRGNTTRVAFTESTFRLATNTNNPSVARSMVDVAEARNWKALRVSGSEDFKRLVWLEASIRGVKAHGYEPTTADQDLLQRARDARALNRIDHTREPAAAASSTAEAQKPSGRGGSGRKQVLAAIDAVLQANRVPTARREAVLAAADRQLQQRQQRGERFEVKVYDKSAPSHRAATVPTPEVQRARERSTPAPAR